MKNNIFWIVLSITLIALLTTRVFHAQRLASEAAPGTAFLYQGRLVDNGLPANGAFDFIFQLYATEAGGTPVGLEQAFDNVAVSDGVFTTRLDFGNVFGGQERWLEVGVRPGDSTGAYTTLAPRQLLTATPYALYSQAAPWSGLVDVPPGFADGVDNDTLYSPGSGLLLDGTVFSADTAYLQRRVVSTCAEGSSMRVINGDGSVTCQAIPAYSAGAGLVLTGTTFSIDASVVQQRVSGSCAVGSTIRQINVDGSVECQAGAAVLRDDPPASHLATILDSTTDVGDALSITIGRDGLGLISYLDFTNGHLKVAHCNDLACTTANSSTIDGAPNVGYYSSITIGADGLGLISYYDGENGNLKVAHCTNVECSGAGKFTLDSANDVGWYTSITIGGDGLGLISYHDDTSGSLKVAHCSNTLCSSATTYTLAGGSVVGWDTAITLGSDQRGLISYTDVVNGDLKIAHCNDLLCSSATLATLDSAGNVGWQSSIAIGNDGLGLVSYYDETNGDLKIAHCQDQLCSHAKAYILDSAGTVGTYSSLSIGGDGLGVISYYDQTNAAMKIAHCGDLACTQGTSLTYSANPAGGHPTALTIGIDGLPLISTVNQATGDLLALHCLNNLCADYLRRR